MQDGFKSLTFSGERFPHIVENAGAFSGYF
jgi:hypothetical protein